MSYLALLRVAELRWAGGQMSHFFQVISSCLRCSDKSHLVQGYPNLACVSIHKGKPNGCSTSNDSSLSPQSKLSAVLQEIPKLNGLVLAESNFWQQKWIRSTIKITFCYNVNTRLATLLYVSTRKILKWNSKKSFYSFKGCCFAVMLVKVVLN